MARMLSLEAAIVRGSIGGRTYLANQYHQIVIRQRTSPVNPNTSFQTMIRAAFANSSVLWNGLTDEERTAWDDYAASLVYQGPLGPYSLPGRNVFLSNITFGYYLNYRTGLPPTLYTQAPELPGFCAITDIHTDVLSAPGIGFSLNCFNSDPDPLIVAAWRSRAFGPARMRFKGPFASHTLKTITVGPDSAGLIDFEGLTDGAVYFVTVRAMALTYGYRISTDSFVRAVSAEVVI